MKNITIKQKHKRINLQKKKKMDQQIAIQEAPMQSRTIHMSYSQNYFPFTSQKK